MFKTVIDTNVIISAIAFGGIPREILNQLITGKIYNYTSERILNEIKEVFQRPKFNYDIIIIKAILHELELISEYIEEAKISQTVGLIEGIVRDRNDTHILACALTAKTDFLITGDEDLLVLKMIRDTKILTPAQFITDC